MIIPPFRPDAGEQFSSTLNNVFMEANGFGPRPTLTAAPGAAVFASAAQVRGAFGGQVPGGAFEGFLASGTKIFRLTASYGYTDLGVTFAVPTGEDESFTQFGVFMMCSNTTDGIYAYNMSTPAGLNAVSGAPKARIIFATNNVLVALGDTTTNSARLATTAFGDQTNWTTAGASKQDMADGGAFTGGGDFGGGPYAILLQQRAVRLMTFGNAGGGAIFALSKIADDVGCVHPRAFCIVNGVCYHLDTKGIFASTPQGSVNIGAQKVNNYFLANCPDLTKVYFSVDPIHTLVRIRYRSVNCGSDIVFNDILDYNYVTQEFIPGTENTSAIFRMATPGYVLNDLDSFGALNGWSQYPLGSPVWQGGNNPVLAGIDSAGKFGFFNGVNAAATLETNTFGDGTRKMVTSAEPTTDDSAATVQLGVKNTLSGSFTWKDPAAIQPSGRTRVRGAGQFQRFRINHAAGNDWSRDTSIDGIVANTEGPR